LVRLIKKYWFLTALSLIFIITLTESNGFLSESGIWLKGHHGTNIVILLIFFSSGLILETGRIRSGLNDIKGLLISLLFIFLFAPLVAVIFIFLPFETGIKIGFLLVAVVPTTLSSGVVMTGAAKGNLSHALLITITANIIAVVTIPATLSGLLPLIGNTKAVSIDGLRIMFKLGGFVLLPLFAGLAFKSLFKLYTDHIESKVHIINQILVLAMVWMALCQAKAVILANLNVVGVTFVLVVVFHGVLVCLALLLLYCLKIGKGKRESVILMGVQKTLLLSIMLQVSLFPQYGQALIVCILHHLVQLLMDSFLVVKLRSAK